MKKERTRGWGWGCLTFAAGIVAGIALTILALVAWAVARPVHMEPLENRPLPGGVDLEVRLSEAFLNATVAEGVAERKLDKLTRIIMDVQPDGLLVATLQGPFSLGDIAPDAGGLETEVRLTVKEGALRAHIERVRVGPVLVNRDTLPDFAQGLFESAEEAMVRVINERLAQAGLEATGLRSDGDSLTLGLRGASAGDL